MRNGPSSPELWGGVECTVNRVGDEFFDQLEFSGHDRRLDDLDRFASLGLSGLRFPVLWERTQRAPELAPNFEFADRGLARLGELGIEPIVGLLHHGSGAAHTSLDDPLFPEKFAAYARTVATRYPSLKRYTPINEPLTTARFSGLYGHWYPHARSDHAFVRMIVNQTRATLLAMRAIREVNPRALLVQTEDMGYVRSTPALRHQADFENERRFLSFDLLAGRVDARHPLHSYLIASGASERELGELREQASPPDVLGINYYVTSERYLDERTQRYPARYRGGNGRQVYADVEAVRVCAEGLVGPGRILDSVHARFGIPIAVTEIHIGCSVAQQSSWLNYVVQEAMAASDRGVPVVALTVWALLGAFGWDTLVTRPYGRYEPGVFELVDGAPQATPLAESVRIIARGEREDVAPGWWTLPSRFYEASVTSLPRPETNRARTARVATR